MSLEEDISEAIIAYPNPSPNTFTIQLNKDIDLTKSLHVFIYDTSGRLIKSYEIDERKFMIDLNANPKGLYFLKTTVPNKNLNLKLQKE
ncbi:MAG: hypothetical protein KatS3mg032_0779 [Cyclobacteriaceae bacterium]|nr:MAG: hypothetical protein KatS3mg032_0779 [Cyclobacteriaceae bacterium]